MITDTPELRRLLFVAQQRRWRFVNIPISVSMEQSDDDVKVEDELIHQARIAHAQATAALLDYLQAMVDT